MQADILILLCSLLCLSGLGALILAGLKCLLGAWCDQEPDSELNGWLLAGVSLCVGQGVYSCMLWIAGYFGLFVFIAWFGMLLGCAYLVYRIIFWVRRGCCKFHFKVGKLLVWQWRSISAWTIVVVISLWLGNQYAIISLAGPIEGVPGMGNWAYKTKIIYLNQGMPSNYFGDYATHYGKFSYPAGFPLLNAAYYTMTGAVNESLIKLHSVILLTLTYSILAGCFFQHWRLWGLVPVVGILPLFLNEACLQIMRSFYSEPLLLFCAVVAVTSLDLDRVYSRQTFLAVFCAGCAAWVKQEGILFFVLLSLFLLILLWKDRVALDSFKKVFTFWLRVAVFPACIFILPWKVFTLFHSVADSDFDFRSAGIIDTSVGVLLNTNSKTQAAVSKVYEVGIEQGYHYAGLFWMAPCLLLLACFKGVRAQWVFPSIGIMMMAIYVFVMAWSLHDMEWHLGATHRYLMLPSICVVACLTTFSTFKTISTNPKKI